MGNKNKPKLLSPVGDLVALKAAIDSGADEIYFGIKGLNMRAGASNFDISEISKIVKACHVKGVKAYLALNTIIYNHELKTTEKIIKHAKKLGVDGVIAWDMAVVELCDKLGIEIHLSTQASVSNYSALSFYKERIKNLKRVVLARECTLDDIKDIIDKIRKNKLNVEIETFIHGAMCVSVSGRCFMSQSLFGRSANRGECLQPCRRKYEAVKIKDPEENHELLLGEDYVMSPKDMCAMPFIEKLIDTGISAFKIEGRNRSPEYVQNVTRAYRMIIDFYSDNKEKIQKEKTERNAFEVLKNKLIQEMKKVYNRDFSTGFYLGKPIDEWCKAYGSKATTSKEYLGRVLNYYQKIKVAEVKIESGDLMKGDHVMFQGPTTGVFEQDALEMQIDGKTVDKIRKGESVGLKVSGKVRKNDKVFRIIVKN